MVEKIIQFSIGNKFLVLLFMLVWIGWGVYSVTQIPISAVPDVTNNQVQVLTTSRNLSTQDIEQFITYPVELEMANLPGVQEIRSISKFGLSVVTVVFDEQMGTYLPRQLIAEKLKSAIEKIPMGFGTPEMGPISTGLGEIYQYILDVKPGYEHRYSTMDLRTIQDWVVKRQLSGIPGVVEVNTWGGLLKQYEVAVNPEKLKSMNVTLSEVFQALQDNNDITGGGYIEKNDESYFVRGQGMVTTPQDIEKIVVKNMDGVPVYIRDISDVRLGSATRFGAITGNGQGEKVMGQVMMLKDASSNEVIRNVKERVSQVQEMLPEGVVINPFLERSELIHKTTLTVAENLTLGALIVIFVLVLLLGNLRSGLIVASIIPLSLLFGISMMNLFGISANLMSLGAIDFGIIIDGAVIIIEYIVFKVNQNRSAWQQLSGAALRREKDRITLESTAKMMQPAVFGQIIILIVFIPILSLTGIEGKMFRPMALSFSFALLGAMILSLTYVPVLASMICKPAMGKGSNFSNRIIEFLQSRYRPVIRQALNRKKLVLGLALLLMGFSVIIFARLGGEFIPTLDEGDYVVQPVLKTGTSLGKTIEIMTRLERILIDQFPEVDQVVSRIGAAEVPTDPMSMEETDIIIKLKPKNQWVHASSKEELADKMKTAMSVIPGLDFEFTQPIEMRFNELVTGVRSDVAIKIYGEDLDQLHGLANQVNGLIKQVPGAADITVEKVAGLPQMAINYHREKIAQYGLNIKELNRMVRMAFAGETAGMVMEGEKRFDLVVRFNENFRTDIANLQRLYVDLPNGSQIPLAEVATVAYQTGPAKISRDDTKRRIVIGINVRNRDVESLVEEIQGILNASLELPSGYYITYGGQFENLQNAKKRLMVVVPIALVLIFVLLYFTFGSVKQALMVYTAIPLAAIGGVLMLWIRELPFSISAGVGFIALFGIAVLNGIVLIEFFNELEEKGVKNVYERVIKGTEMRLRPVLLTASAAALGFFPMAFSTSAGAEVQRPLATVVIGGLITATLLTLVVLPVLYTIFTRQPQTPPEDIKRPAGLSKVPLLLFLFTSCLFVSGHAMAQTKVINLQQAIDLSVANNAGLRASSLRIDQHQKLEKTALNVDRTGVYYSFDENNIAENGRPLDIYGLKQSFSFPGVYALQRNLYGQNTQLQRLSHLVRQNELVKEVSQAYYELLYLAKRLEQFSYLDSIYGRFAEVSERRFQLGETNYLEKITGEARHMEVRTLRKQAHLDVDTGYEKLGELIQLDEDFEIEKEELSLLELDSLQVLEKLPQNPRSQYFDQLSVQLETQTRVERSKLWPDFHAEYFLGYGRGQDAMKFRGYQFGLGIPLINSLQKGRIQASRLEMEITKKEAENYHLKLMARYRQLMSLIRKYEEAIIYYRTGGLGIAAEIIQVAERSYISGETDFMEYVISLESASQINLRYLENLNDYNQTVLEILYLSDP